jgi:hypothetical protein
MNVVSMKPSVWRTAAALLLMIGGCMAASGFTATGDQFWRRTGELVGIVVLFLTSIWFMFVPTRLEFDRVELTIRYLFRRSCTLPWYKLELYGSGNNVFMLQLEGQSFQIFSQAFATRDWHQLMNFLSTRFPERKADGWAGASLFRWRRK